MQSTITAPRLTGQQQEALDYCLAIKQDVYRAITTARTDNDPAHESDNWRSVEFQRARYSAAREVMIMASPLKLFGHICRSLPSWPNVQPWGDEG